MVSHDEFMNCIEITKIESWLTGKDPGALDRSSWFHLGSCPTCHRKLRTALAVKTAALPISIWPDAGTNSCSRKIDHSTLLAYLDDMMELPERAILETHLASCEVCKQALLRLEGEIFDAETSQVEVPGHILSKALAIGEVEIARREAKRWSSVLEKALSPIIAGGIRPQWAGAVAVLLIVLVTSVLYFKKPHQPLPKQQALVEVKSLTAPVPSPVTTAAAVDSAVVRRVSGILAQIERVTDRGQAGAIKLHVVDSKEYIAQISPDGELMLSTQYIATTQNDDELAFLLAHEVAHRQHPANCILSFSTAAHSPAKILNSTQQKQAELQADRMGLFLASVAGFHATAANSLFSRIQDIANISDASHPEFQARLKETGKELSSIVRTIDLFQVGVSFFNTEQYSRSVAIFEAVTKMFPSREALNDLGLAYHKLALEYSPQNWGFKKSVILDPVARAIEPVREELPEANLFDQFLNKALEQYRKAISHDPDYVAVRINLAGALDDMGNYPVAANELEAVLKMHLSVQEKARALNNLGVIAAKQSMPDKALSYFQRAAEADARFSDPHFNLARTWELKNNSAAATDEYSRYVQLASQERDGWLRMAYNKLNKRWDAAESGNSESLPKLGRFQLGNSLSSLSKQLGQPTVTWNLRTPTQFDFSVSLFESAGLVVSGSEGIIDFVQTTPRYSGVDSVNHLAAGMMFGEVASQLRQSSRVTLPGAMESYIDFDRGLGVNLRDRRVDAWYIFEPLN
jgi:tetratricopeptide (TPR) repeat protein/anti-sigma factor RsiW